MPELFEIIQTTDPADFETCAQLMAQQDPWKTLGFDLSDCRLAFPGEHRKVFLLKTASGIRGFMVIQHLGSFRGYIQLLCVHPDAHNSGYGSALLDFAEKEITAYSPNVFICVSSFNKKAHALYLRKGFEEVGVLKNFIKKGLDEILLRKTSGPNFHYKAPAVS